MFKPGTNRMLSITGVLLTGLGIANRRNDARKQQPWCHYVHTSPEISLTPGRWRLIDYPSKHARQM